MRETVKIIGEKKSPIPSPFSPLLNSLSLFCVLFIHSLFCQRGHGTRVSTRGKRSASWSLDDDDDDDFDASIEPSFLCSDYDVA